MADREHIWIEKWGLTVCQTCLIVQRADGKNKPCRGPGKLRDMEKPIMRALLENVLAEAHRIHATRPWPHKYTAPFGALAGIGDFLAERR